MFIPVDYNLSKEQKKQYKEALKMKSLRKSEKEIFRKTNVSFHLDGQENIEISDHEARLIPNPNEEIDRLKVLMTEVARDFQQEKISLKDATKKHNALKSEFNAQHQRIQDTMNGKLDRKRLSYYLQHDELYKTNPELANVEIKFFDPKKEGCAGFIDLVESYYSMYGVINIGSDALKDEEDFKYRVLHEIQHLIQIEKGWSNGLGADAFVHQSDERNKVAMDEYANLDLKDISQRISNEKKSGDSQLDMTMRVLTREERAIIHNHTLCIKNNEKPSIQYRTSFGEIQAYSVSERINLKPGERRKTLPLHSQKEYLKDPIYGSRTLIKKSILKTLTKKALTKSLDAGISL